MSARLPSQPRVNFIVMIRHCKTITYKKCLTETERPLLHAMPKINLNTYIFLGHLMKDNNKKILTMTEIFTV